MSRGPMELVVAEFPGPVPGEALAPELRDNEGDPAYEALDQVVHTVDGLIAEQDLTEIAGELSAGATGVVLLFEHLRARRLRGILTGAGGEVVFTERIPAPVVEAVQEAAVG